MHEFFFPNADIFQENSDVIPLPGLLPATIPTNALVINVVAFVLSLVTTAVVLCRLWNIQEDLLGSYVAPVVAILAVFNLTAFSVDLALLTAVKKAFGATATVNVGNGTWLTLTPLFLLLLGLYFNQQVESTPMVYDVNEKQLPQLPQDIEARGSSTGWQEGTTLPVDNSSKHSLKSPKPVTQITPYVEPPKLRIPPSASGSIDEKTPLTPVRRLPDILINGVGGRDESHRTSTVLDIIREDPPSRTSSIEYAPSAYSTYFSDESSVRYFTPGALSSASTPRSPSFPTRHPARRSTLNPHNIERLLNAAAGPRRSKSTTGTYPSHHDCFLISGINAL